MYACVYRAESSCLLHVWVHGYISAKSFSLPVYSTCLRTHVRACVRANQQRRMTTMLQLLRRGEWEHTCVCVCVSGSCKSSALSHRFVNLTSRREKTRPYTRSDGVKKSAMQSHWCWETRKWSAWIESSGWTYWALQIAVWMDKVRSSILLSRDNEGVYANAAAS